MANPHNLSDQIHELFFRWRRRESRNASVENLIVAARTEGLDDLLVRAELSGEFDNMFTSVTEGKLSPGNSVAATIFFPSQLPQVNAAAA